MTDTAAQRFDANAANYRSSEVHRASPTVERLRALLPGVTAVCDVGCGAGHTAVAFAGPGVRVVAVDPSPNMLAQVGELATERRVAVETVRGTAEAVPLAGGAFDLVVSRLAAHHFADVAAGVREMARLARPGGHVAVIDLEGDPDPAIDALNHDIEVLHDPTHQRSYTAGRWRELFAGAGLEVVACEGRWREFPAGLTVGRWCELGRSGEGAVRAIRGRLSSAPPEWLAALDVVRDGDGEFRLPIRTLLIVGRKHAEPNAAADAPKAAGR